MMQTCFFLKQKTYETLAGLLQYGEHMEQLCISIKSGKNIYLPRLVLTSVWILR
jgi:hypothetical protein